LTARVAVGNLICPLSKEGGRGMGGENGRQTIGRRAETLFDRVGVWFRWGAMRVPKRVGKSGEGQGCWKAIGRHKSRHREKGAGFQPNPNTAGQRASGEEQNWGEIRGARTKEEIFASVVSSWLALQNKIVGRRGLRRKEKKT